MNTVAKLAVVTPDQSVEETQVQIEINDARDEGLYEGYDIGLSAGFDFGYAAGYRAATAVAGKIANKAIEAFPLQTEENLRETLIRLICNWNSIRFGSRRRFAGATAAKRDFLADDL